MASKAEQAHQIFQKHEMSLVGMIKRNEARQHLRDMDHRKQILGAYPTDAT